MRTRVAIDIGGGFADLAAIDLASGQTFWSKTYTTPEDLQQCVRTVFTQSGVEPASVLQLLHGQTLVINAILQRTGARVGLITTRGFRDILAIQRANRRDIFNLKYQKPEPFVSRGLRLEVVERVSSSGEVLAELDPVELRSAFDTLLAAGVDAIAVAFINSYANPANEQRAQSLMQGWMAETAHKPYLTISAEVCREWREYERTNTAVLNAYVQPAMQKYLVDLERQIRAVGVDGKFSMMLSGGGLASFSYASRCPIETIESGPVAGIIGATRLGEIVGERNIIAIDGGSTTTKASLIENLSIRYKDDYAVERDRVRPGYPVKVPVVDVVEIGIGGNSLVWLGSTGHLSVGPRNAGATVGPAAYGRGGTQPTLTDAYLAAGFLNPETFLGGKFKIRTDLAEGAFATLADHFSVTPKASAAAAIQVAVHEAAQLLRLISVQRGVDPRDFCLLCYGGSGPLIAAIIAAELGIPRVLIPVIPPGNFSAWGLLMSDLKHTLVRTVITRLDKASAPGRLQAALEMLIGEVKALFIEDGIEQGVHYAQDLDLRYYGQEHTIRIPFKAAPGSEELDLTSSSALAAAILEAEESFRQRHAREYGFSLQTAVELVNVIVTGEASTPRPSLAPFPPATGAVPTPAFREVHWPGAGPCRTAIYRRSTLEQGTLISGPAIIEEDTTTTGVPAGTIGRIDSFGNLILERSTL